MINAVFFDLDNTLYPASASMEADIIARMTDYAAAFIGISTDEAQRLRKANLAQYGTTLEWLMAEHGLTDYDDYFACVHPSGEESVLTPDPQLRPFLAGIHQPKFIFTNAPMEHATRILDKFGIADCFQKIYDVRFNQLTGKPSRSAVERVLADSGWPAAESLFVDDVPRYVRGFTDCGGHGVLIDHFDTWPEETLPRIRTIYELSPYLNSKEAQ
jgi:putative hydrolase of the HAD superfamily